MMCPLDIYVWYLVCYIILDINLMLTDMVVLLNVNHTCKCTNFIEL